MPAITIKEQIITWVKGTGSWFLTGNAFLYSQTHPSIALGYAIAVFIQPICHRLGVKTNNALVNIITGTQGTLFLSAAWTLIVGIITAIYGSPILMAAGITAGIVNMVQALIFGGTIKFPDNEAGERYKNIALAICELGVLYSLWNIAQNAGCSSGTATALVVPGVIFTSIRAFRRDWLSPDFAYADMLFLTIVIGYHAIDSGNVLNAISRVTALIGFTRLAVSRANNDGVKTIFAVEEWIPKYWGRLTRKIST